MPQHPHDARPGPEERAREGRRWALRSLLAGPPTALAAFVVGWLDPEGGETVLAATALAVAFGAVFFGLAGLFALQYTRETLPGEEVPRWAVPCGVAGIAGGFVAGLTGLVT